MGFDRFREVTGNLADVSKSASERAVLAVDSCQLASVYAASVGIKDVFQSVSLRHLNTTVLEII